jgi:hypothetical protein
LADIPSGQLLREDAFAQKQVPQYTQDGLFD